MSIAVFAGTRDAVNKVVAPVVKQIHHLLDQLEHIIHIMQQGKPMRTSVTSDASVTSRPLKTYPSFVFSK